MMTSSQSLPIATNWIMLSRLCKDTYVLSGTPEHRCIIGIGRIGREQLRWWVTKQLQTSHMQEEIKHTKKATAASCSVVWVAKSNGPLHPLALVI
ncbi:unnamed protein product [Musa textilis]